MEKYLITGCLWWVSKYPTKQNIVGVKLEFADDGIDSAGDHEKVLEKGKSLLTKQEGQLFFNQLADPPSYTISGIILWRQVNNMWVRTQGDMK